MLWKQSYETKIVRDVQCPVAVISTLDGSPVNHERQVWIGGFGFDAIADQGVWWRLFRSDFPGDPSIKKVFIFDRVEVSQFENALALVPKSEVDQCLLIEDVNGLWQKLVQPDSLTRGFAAIIEASQISLLMIGPPTEGAWEEFSNRWRTKT